MSEEDKGLLDMLKSSLAADIFFRCVMTDWVDAIEAIVTVCPTTSEWLVNYLSSGQKSFMEVM